MEKQNIKKKKKKSRWIKKRHSFFRLVLYPFIWALCKIKYHIKIEKCKEKRQFLVVSNHQTTFDQFFLGLGFKRHLYYVTNDDILIKKIREELIDNKIDCLFNDLINLGINKKEIIEYLKRR